MRLVALFPRSWRRRYGEEFEALLEESDLSLGGLLDLARGAWDARRHPQPHLGRGGEEMAARLGHGVGIVAAALAALVVLVALQGLRPLAASFQSYAAIVAVVAAAAIFGATGARVPGAAGGGGTVPRTQPYAWYGQTNAYVTGPGQHTLQFGCVSPPPPPTGKGLQPEGQCLGGPVASITIVVT